MVERDVKDAVLLLSDRTDTMLLVVNRDGQSAWQTKNDLLRQLMFLDGEIKHLRTKLDAMPA